ncbi:MAG: NAD(P)/FAD-dependent oxidoreductase [Thermoguttaceae bacterium]|nr:NAD(P)/FAD-dependent oxidoreductase [Thermoguttaceae bacterium]MDW8038198.1 NAD(P)/FAD-dependent oxidoreductase [Thermoguttaceae bacterium]
MHVVILGAGATGLTAAYLLRRAGVEVTLLEAASKPGGLLTTFSLGQGDPIECYYHHCFTHDVELQWLLAELGLSDRLIYRPTTMAVYREGRFWPFNSPLDVLRFRPIGLLERFRLGLSGWLLSRLAWYSRQEEVSALAWFRRWAGPKATQAVWLPLLQGKFGELADRVSLAWMAGRLHQRASSRRSGQEQLGYLRGSLQVLVDRLVERLADWQTAMCWQCPAEALLVENGRVVGVRVQGKAFRADALVVTTAPAILAGLVRPICSEYASQLDSIQYLAAVCMLVSLRRPLTQVYWTNITDPDYDFIGLVEHTQLASPDWYGGRHLVYLTRYVRPEEPLWQLPEQQLQERWLEQLERLIGRPIRNQIEGVWLFRARYAAPLPELGFSRRIPAMRSPLPGLFVAGMVHIYPDERSVNNCIRVAAELVRILGFPAIADQVPRGLSLAGRYV